MDNLEVYAQETAEKARMAAQKLQTISGAQKDSWLQIVADRLPRQHAAILEANARDLEEARENGLSEAMMDRLTLNSDRIRKLSQAVLEIRDLPDPIGEVLESSKRPNGLQIEKVRVPLGVVFFIFESRPNVTVDAAAICLKSGNAVILRGGKEAFHTNQALHAILTDSLHECGLPQDAVQLVNTTDRAVVGHFLQRSDSIDVTIPRGGRALIERVTAEARMPVIKHFDGICHVYVDETAPADRSVAITVNSKCQRPGVCNAAETLLVHQAHTETLLPRLLASLEERGVQLHCCPRSLPHSSNGLKATDGEFGTEWLALEMSVRVVTSLDEALDHIRRFGSGHTEAIVTESLTAARRFRQGADSSAVMINASTRFNDGGEFGLGAEIGISTDRFHARGPCGLKEMTSYKYVVQGEGQIRT